MGIASRRCPEHAERRRDGVTSAFDRQLHEVLGVEVLGIRRKRCPCRVLDPLIDRQDRHIPGTGESTSAEEPLQAAQHPHVAIGQRVNTVDEIRTGQVELLFRNRQALVLEQTRLVPEDGLDSWKARTHHDQPVSLSPFTGLRPARAGYFARWLVRLKPDTAEHAVSAFRRTNQADNLESYHRGTPCVPRPLRRAPALTVLLMSAPDREPRRRLTRKRGTRNSPPMPPGPPA